MPSAGELIRIERVKRNRILSEIATETCICTRYLEAIEADNPKILPGHFFHRSFIRQYAAALRLEESLTQRILDAVEPVPEMDPMPALSLPLQIAHVEMQQKPLARVPTRVAAALLVVVLAGCSGLYALWHRAEEKADLMQVAQAASSDTPDVTTPLIPAMPSPATAPGNAAPQSTSGEPQHPTIAAAESDPGKISVDLSATEKTWVSLSSAGHMIFSGVLDPSQTKNFALGESARLLTGNAAGLDVRMNGRPLGPLGSRGQVRVVVFNQDNYQILSPHKM
jgi:cytoskeleton protein RodZ